MTPQVRIVLNEQFYLRDPQETELGRKIISKSIVMIDKLGIEDFTFAKLAQEIGSTEASVYRYFENKHRLLIYLVSWYWAWLDYLLIFRTNNIYDPEHRLNIVINIISESHKDDPASSWIDESLLHRVVINEANKLFLTKHVDEENKEGLFVHHKMFVQKIAQTILEYAPDYPYSRSLASMLVDEAHRQVFLAHHLPSLTDFKSSDDVSQKIENFISQVMFSAINPYKKR